MVRGMLRRRKRRPELECLYSFRPWLINFKLRAMVLCFHTCLPRLLYAGAKLRPMGQRFSGLFYCAVCCRRISVSIWSSAVAHTIT
jgi:hypothetical protein